MNVSEPCSGNRCPAAVVPPYFGSVYGVVCSDDQPVVIDPKGGGVSVICISKSIGIEFCPCRSVILPDLGPVVFVSIKARIKIAPKYPQVSCYDIGCIATPINICICPIGGKSAKISIRVTGFPVG